MRNLFFLTLSFCLSFSFSAKAEEIDDQEQMELLSYQEFRLMSNSEQNAYIQELQNIIADLAAKGIEVEPSAYEIFFPKRWTWLQELMMETAYAADVTKASDKRTSSPEVTAAAKAKADAQTAVDNAKLKADAAAAKAKGVSTTFQDYGNIPDSQTTPQPNKFSEAWQVKRMPSFSDPKTTFKSPIEKKLAADAKGAPKGKLRCIYAGFTLESTNCVPKTEYKNGKDVYACNKTAKSTILPEKPDAKISILCNPALFGLIKGKPICISFADRSSSTKKCLQAARKDPGTLDAARKLMQTDEPSFKMMKATVENFCTKDKAKTYLEGFEESSKKDIEATCVHYLARVNDFGGKFRMATYNEKNNTVTPAKTAPLGQH